MDLYRVDEGEEDENFMKRRLDPGLEENKEEPENPEELRKG